jgi:hypothetical protein
MITYVAIDRAARKTGAPDFALMPDPCPGTWRKNDLP